MTKVCACIAKENHGNYSESPMLLCGQEGKESSRGDHTIASYTLFYLLPPLKGWFTSQYSSIVWRNVATLENLYDSSRN